MPIGFIIISVLVMILAILLRGRRVDDHPLCRKCGFDLVGAPHGATQCAECGSDLSDNNAILRGQRRRSPLAIKLTIGALVLALIGTALAGTTFVKNFKWIEHKPASWLLADLDAADTAVASAALSELVRRDEAQSLSLPRQADLVAHLCDLVATNTLAAPHVEWLPVLERAWLDDRLTDQQRLEFAQCSASLELSTKRGHFDTPGVIEQHSAMPIELVPGGTIGVRSQAMFIAFQPTLIRFNDAVLDHWPFPTEIELSPGRGLSSDGRSPLAIPMLVEPGQYDLHVQWQIEATLGRKRTTSVSWEMTTDTKITVTEPGQRAVQYLTDQQSSDQLRDAFHLNIAGLRDATPEDDQLDVIGFIELDEIDAFRAAFHVQVLDDVGTIALVRGAGNHTSFHVRLPPDRPRPTAATVILYPAVDDLSITFGRRENPPRPIWAGSPIRIENHPIHWYDNIDSPAMNESLRRCFADMEHHIDRWNRENP